MAKTLKLKNDDEMQIAANEQYLNSLYESGQIDQERYDQIQRLKDNAAAWLKVNSVSKRKGREYRRQISDRMVEIATGKNPSTNFSINSGNAVQDTINDSANNIVYTTNGNIPVISPYRKSTQQTAPAAASAPLFFYNALETTDSEGWDKWGEGTSIKDKIRSIGKVLLNNATGLFNAYKSGQTIHGYSGSYDGLGEKITGLQRYLDTLEQKDNVGVDEIYNFVNSYARQLAPNSASFFTNEFRRYIDGEDPKEKNWRALRSEGYTIDNSYANNRYLNKNKYKILKDKNGKQYIYDENFNLIQDPIKHIDLDTDDTVFQVGDNLFIGNMRDIDADKNHVLYKDIKDYQSSLIKKDAYTAGKWSDDYDASSQDLTLALSNAGILKTGVNYADVSNLFEGTDKQVIAINNDGSAIKEDYYGRPDLSNASIYYIGDDGNYVKTSFDDYQQKSRYDRMGFGEDKNQFAVGSKSGDFNNNWKNYANKDIDWDTDFYGESFWERLNPFGSRYESGWGNILEFLPGVQLHTIFGQDDIVDDPKGFAESIIKSLKNWGDGKQTDHDVYVLQNFKYDSDPLQLLTFLLNPKNSKQFQLSKEDRAYLLSLWNDAYKNETQGTYDDGESVESHKQGGVIKAASGIKTVTLTGEEVESNIKKQRKEAEDNKPKAPKEEGELAKKHNETKLENEFSTSEILRLTSLGADLAGAIAAFAPGAGSAVALGTGLGATAAELVADMSDPTVSFGSALGNLVTNLGFTAAGVIPGAKLGKVGAKVLKWVPKITAVLAAGNLALNEDIHDSLAKAVKEPDTLTIGDWRNITIALSSVLGITKTVKSGYTRHKAESIGKSKSFTKEGLTTKALSEDQVKTFNKALKSGNDEEIKKLAQQYGLKEEGLKKYKEEIKRRSWDFWKERKGYKELEFSGNHDSKAMKKMYDEGDKATKEWMEYLYPGMKDRGWKNFQYTPGQKVNMPKAGTFVTNGKKYNIPFKIKDQVHNSPLNPMPQAPMQPNQAWQPHSFQNVATSITPNAIRKGPNLIQQQEELINKKYLDDLDFIIQEQMKQMAGLNKKQLANVQGFNPKYGEQFFKKAYNNSIKASAKAKAPVKNNKVKVKSKKGGTPKKYLGGTILPWLNTVNY